jgi:Sialic acid synthase
MSTGMANQSEILDAIETVEKYGSGDFIILHCVSGYPTPASEIHLNTINLLKQKFGVEVGLSDHTLGNTSAILSIGYGVKLIEKHFTKSRKDGGPDADFSMEPHELKELVEQTNIAFDALGTASFERRGPEQENLIFRRSIYVVEDIKAGEKLTKKNIRRIRPGYGMKPKYYEEIIGKEVKKDIEAGSPLLKEDLK